MSEERKAAERMIFRVVGTAVALAACVWLLPIVWDKLSPFIIAIPLAALLQPLIEFLQKKLKMKRGLATVILVLLGLGVAFGVLTWILNIVTEQLTLVMEHSGDIVNELITSMRKAVNTLTSSALNISPDAEKWIRSAMNEAATKITGLGADAAKAAVTYSMALVGSIPYGLIYISFLAMGLYFIAIKYDDIRSYLPGGSRMRQDSNTTRLTKAGIHSLAGYLRVQVTFSLITLVISLIYLKCFGVQYAGLLSLLAGIMEMIPMIGSGALYIILGLMLLLAGNTAVGIQLLALTGGLQVLRRVLEPKLMSDSIGISPLLSLIGMFVGMRFGGVLGLIGGPVLMAVLIGAIRNGFFKLMIRDIHTIEAYFHRRWKSDPEAQTAQTDQTTMGDKPQALNGKERAE